MNTMEKSNFTHDQRLLHMNWCIKNDIIIYYNAIDNYTGNIVLVDKGFYYTKQEVFRQPTYKKPLKVREKRWWEEIMKLYTKKYNEYNSN